MDCLNHWIPACAGMTRGLRGMMVGAVGGVAGRGSVGMTAGLRSGICREWQGGCRDGNPLVFSSLSFQRRLESRKRGRGGEGVTGFGRRRVGGHPPGCHSRVAGMDCLNHWIPAFAGMTAGVPAFAGMTQWLRGITAGAGLVLATPNTDNFCQYLTESALNRLCLSRASWPLCLPALSGGKR